jgi:hypothetical protein
MEHAARGIFLSAGSNKTLPWRVNFVYRKLPQKRWMRVQASSSALVAVA